MSSRATSQSLSVLLPSLAQPQRKLLSLAESLLALSRQRASHLKPEEEIARAYACCEIACDRLRADLRLPPTKKGGAPCKPVVYRKLLGYLEGVLGNDEVATPGKRKRAAELEVQETPTKKSKHTPDVTPSKSSGKRKSGFVGRIKAHTTKETQQEAPEFVMPAIRKICRALKTPEMAPHVYTGTCVVLRLSSMWPESDDDSTEQLEPQATTLLVALYLLVLTRMQTGKMTTKILRSVSSRAVDMFDAVSEPRQIEDCIKRVNREGYCKGQDWWNSIPEGVFDFSLQNLEATDHADTEVDMPDDSAAVEAEDEMIIGRRKDVNMDEPDPDGVLLPGLGTMMSDAVDWLSDDRKAHFQKWKKDLLRQLDKATAAA